MSDDKKARDLDLLKSAVASSKGRGKQPRQANEMLYRGQPIAGRGRGGGAPGSPGSGSGRASHQNGASGADVKEALRNLTQLFNDGLITTAEYDAKRGEILDRI